MYVAYFSFERRPIRQDELRIDSVQQRYKDRTYPYICVDPTAELVSRCQKAGGTIQNNVTSIGLGLHVTLGCYPFGKTSDEGKKCTLNFQCQGECIWLHGDAVTGDESKTCSKYKKPYFVYPKTRLPNDAQGLCKS